MRKLNEKIQLVANSYLKDQNKSMFHETILENKGKTWNYSKKTLQN